uniref:Uncharacterized protein n=1 Tax=Candidatus Kentrum sp. UNK TaxID=2126344 RepID=A0A451AMH7_9GAMM|nr:MAG: Protein of unknown function (DUF1804) [Candidatus Kentron sp. UNK]VFK72595.1 MAG: Protein of unknown function (DUF1804) [Candidatus Kentron sp. UNK]
MVHSQETRNAVRRRYVEGLPLTSAAKTCDVSYETARDWKARAKERGDDWDTARAAWRIGEEGTGALQQQFVDGFTRQFLLVHRDLEAKEDGDPAQKAHLLASLSDSYAKFTKSAGRLIPEVSGLGTAMDVLKTIADYLKAHDRETLGRFQEHLEGISAVLGKRYEKRG